MLRSRKRLLALLVVLFLVAGAAAATRICSVTYHGGLDFTYEYSIDDPDGNDCCFHHNEDGPMGPRGVYECQTASGSTVWGYGPPRLSGPD